MTRGQGAYLLIGKATKWPFPIIKGTGEWGKQCTREDRLFALDNARGIGLYCWSSEIMGANVSFHE